MFISFTSEMFRNHGDGRGRGVLRFLRGLAVILLTTINIPNTAMAIVHAGVAATTVDEASTADVDPPLLSQPDTLQQQEEEEEGEVKDAAAGSNRGMSGAGEPPAKAGEEEEADAVLLESAKVLPEEILEHGNNLLQEGKSKEAVEVLTEAVKQFQEVCLAFKTA